ncbi:uncharacterized protein YALI1_F25708g [Yarrowia lipolytica]|uniref:Uncharacterized protein n=1 Tax=Yarrowia lipolytica TaxID=4952 RepID=A0A1D8NP73_YARLL|nr:hypothetical protein YALI1_F25708g [Yarrowia lipolytica]
MYYSNLYQDPLYQVAQKSPSTDSRSSDSASTTPTTPTSTHDFVYPSNYQYLSYKHTNPSRRNQGPSDDIPPVPEMPPIEALDLSPSGTGNTATTATATYPNVALSKRRSQAHINRDSNSSGSVSSRRMYDQRHQQHNNNKQQQQQTTTILPRVASGPSTSRASSLWRHAIRLVSTSKPAPKLPQVASRTYRPKRTALETTASPGHNLIFTTLTTFPRSLFSRRTTDYVSHRLLQHFDQLHQ